jgi:hypothetical protein
MPDASLIMAVFLLGGAGDQSQGLVHAGKCCTAEPIPALSNDPDGPQGLFLTAIFHPG